MRKAQPPQAELRPGPVIYILRGSLEIFQDEAPLLLPCGSMQQRTAAFRCPSDRGFWPWPYQRPCIFKLRRGRPGTDAGRDASACIRDRPRSCRRCRASGGRRRNLPRDSGRSPVDHAVVEQPVQMRLRMVRRPVGNVIELGIAPHHPLEHVALDAHEAVRRLGHLDEAVGVGIV